MRYRALLDQTKAIRGYLLRSTKGLSEEQLLRVPDGFKNNILWNLGHAITDNCSMLYPPTGKEIPVPESYLGWFAPETSPADWTTTPNHEEILITGQSVLDKLVDDCVSDRMEEYEPLRLGDNAVLDNIAQAIAHCNIHEGIHLGIIMSLRKLV
jgi:hypothetical protein